MARLTFLLWLVLPTGLVLAAGAASGATGCMSHGAGSGASALIASTSSVAAVVPKVKVHPRAHASRRFVRGFVLPGYFAGGAFGFGYPRGGYNYSNNAPAGGGYVGNTPGNNGPNIFSGANLGPRAQQQPAPAGNAAAPAAPADPPADLPSRDWTIVNDQTGDTTIQAKYAGVLDHKVVLRKSDGRITLVALDQLSVADQDYVAEQTGRKSS